MKDAVFYHITPAGPEDAELLAELEQRCFSDPWPAEAFRAMMVPGRSRYLIARTEGEAAAYAGLSWVLDEGSIDNIATLPEYRRRGAAEALLRALTDYARETGLATLTLEVREGNGPAIALYRKLGFVPVGRRKNYYEKPREDAILMTAFLEGASRRGEA